MRFRIKQEVRIVATGETKTIIWADLFGGKFYRLDDGILYVDSELEAVEAEEESGSDEED